MYPSSRRPPAAGDGRWPHDAGRGGTRAPAVLPRLSRLSDHDTRANRPATVEHTTRVGRSRYRRACAAGAVLSGVLFFWMLSEGTLDPLRLETADSGGYFDAQARSWFEGRWDLPREATGFEAFVLDGRHYLYFGPVPSLLRVPVLAVTDRLDHRLSVLSMTSAFVVTMTAATALGWRIRGLVRGPDAPVSRVELLAAFGYTTLLGGGSTVLFLASQAGAYHEAMLWAVAFTLGSFTFLVDHLARPSARALGLATVLAAAAICSRASVGVAPVIALGAVAAAAVSAAAARRASRHRAGGPWTRRAEAPGRWLRCPAVPAAASVLSVLVPVGLYASVNMVKFGSLFRLPMDRQVYISQARPSRVAALADNGGSLFGLKFVPTNLLHYLRPDAFDLDRLFPFITAPGRPPTVIGNVTFDGLTPTSSLTVTMPLFVLLAAVGLVVVARGRPGPSTEGPGPLRSLVLGGFAATLAGLSIAYNTQRYHADFLPLLVVGSLAGLHHLLAGRPDPAARSRERGRGSSVIRSSLVVGVVVVAAATVYVNAALALVHQRTLVVQAEGRAGFVGFQQGLDRRLFGDRPPVGVETGTELPADAEPGQLLIVGECEGLYQSIGEFQDPGRPSATWRPVERSAATGGFRLALGFPDDRPSTPEPLLVSGSPGNRSVLAVEYLTEDTGRMSLGIEGTGEWYRGEPFTIDPAGEQTFDIEFDRRTLQVTVLLDDAPILATYFWSPEPDPEISVGEDGFRPMVAPRFTGRLVDEPLATPICDDLLERLRGG